MLLGKQLATVTTATADAVERIEHEGALVRQEFDAGVSMLVIAIAGLAGAVLLGAFVIAAGRP